MNLLKKSTAIFMVLLTLFTMVPLSVFAARDSYTAETQSDVSYEATNPLGEVLSDAMAEEQTEQNQGYYILDVTVEEDIATAEYSAPDNAQLIVAVYNEEGTKMITSAKADADSSESEAEIIFDVELPEFFMIKAFMLDSENKPVCRNFESIKYTEAFQEFLKKETTDFDEEKVINLDNSTKSNFAVISDGAEKAEQTQTENILTVNDYENGIYVFENANSDITDLREGDVLYFVYGEGAEDYILTKVGNTENKNGTVTITSADEFEISDFFSYIKIDTDEVQSEEQSEYNLKRAAIDVNPKSEFSVGISNTYEKNGFSCSISGTASFKMKLEFYYDVRLFDEDYYHITNTVDYEVEGELAFSVRGAFETDPPIGICDVIFPITAGLNGIISLDLAISLEGKANVKGTITILGRNGFRNISGQPSESLSIAPSTVYKFDTDLEITFTITPIITVEFIALKVFEIGVGAEVNIIISASFEFFEATTETFPDRIHECDKCIEGTFDIQYVVFAQAEIGFGNKKKNIARLEFSVPIIHLGVFYITLKSAGVGYELIKFGWGKCPNIKYKVNLTVLDEENAPIENVVASEVTVVTTSDEEAAPPVADPVTTNEEGKAIAYYNINKHSVRTEHEHYIVDPDRMSGLDMDFEIPDVEEDDEYVPLNITVYMKMEADGKCGDTAYYTLYDDGTLYITGEGDMWDFTGDYDGTMRINSPWYEDYLNINTVVIENGITHIGSMAFMSYYNLDVYAAEDSLNKIDSNIERIEIPSSVTSIGESAFANCRSLTDVTIPVGITKLDSVFYNCDSITTMVIPDSVTSLNSTFACCDNLTDMVIPEGVEILNGTFGICRNLSKVTLPESITDINDSAFAGCVGLKNINIPDKTKTIGENVFAACTGLMNVIIPDSVQSIGFYAFANCENLEYVIIGDGVTDIANQAFYNCSNLKSITFSSSVSHIGIAAFAGCTKLCTYYKGTEEQWGAIRKESLNEELYPVYYISAITTHFLLPRFIATSDSFITESIPTFPDLTYLFAVVRDDTAEDIFSADNLLYIDQKTAEGETLTFSFELDEDVTDYDVVYFSSDLTSDIPDTPDEEDPTEPTEEETTNSEETTERSDGDITEAPSDTTAPVQPTPSDKTEPSPEKTTVALGKNPAVTTTVPVVSTTEKEDTSSVKVQKPAKVKIKKPKSKKKKQITVTWAKVKDAKGYQVVYSASKKFKKKLTKTKLIKKAKTIKTTLKKLKSGKKYFIRIRAYKNVNGKKLYGAYSKVMSIKVK